MLAGYRGTHFASGHLGLLLNAAHSIFWGNQNIVSGMVHFKLPPSSMWPACLGQNGSCSCTNCNLNAYCIHFRCDIGYSFGVCHSLPVQFLIILCMVGLDVGIQTGEERKNNPLIIANSVGLIVMAIWSWLAYRAVKHEDRRLAWVLTVLLPIMYILPVVDITLGKLRLTAACFMSALC